MDDSSQKVPVPKKWTPALITRTKSTVNAMLAEKQSRGSKEQALKFAATKALLLAAERSELQQIMRFFFILAAVDLHLESPTLKTAQAHALLKNAHEILITHGVAPLRSKLGHLHGEVHLRAARLTACEGRHWEAAVAARTALAACVRATDRSAVQSFKLELAARMLRLGFASGAAALIEEIDLALLHDRDQAAASCLLTRCLRLSGRIDEALVRIPDKQAPLDQSWERTVLECSKAGDFRGLGVLVRKDKPHFQADWVCKALLYNHAADQLLDRRICPRLTTHLRRQDLSFPYGASFFELTRLLDSLEPGEAPDGEQSAKLHSYLARCQEFDDIEQELLAWAAAARIFARLQDFRQSSVILSRYRALSWSLSDGRNPDALGLVGSLISRSWFGQSSSDQESTDEADAAFAELLPFKKDA